MKQFNRLGIALITLLVFSGCQREIYRINHEFSIPGKSKEPALLQFIVDKKEYSNVLESKNLNKVLDYTKIPYQNIDLKTFNENQEIAPTARVICLHNPNMLNDVAIDSLMNFVAKGGTLYVTKAFRDPRMAFLLGLKPDANWEQNKKASGFHFNTPMFPGKKGFSFDDKSAHLGFSRSNFLDDINVLVSAINNHDYPVLIENHVGKGRVLFFNSGSFFSKNMRGFLFAGVLNGLEGVPYPITNVATIFLDDFPSPTYDIYKEPIKSELNITVSDYVKDVWWPDMKKYAIEENIKYTAYVTFDYNVQIAPPFNFEEWNKNTFTVNGGLEKQSTWIGKDVINSGHELGFHGYNHVSLLKDEWKNPEYIVTSLNAAVKKWKVLDFKRLPISYVPPSNYIDSVGLAKLNKGMPTLRFMQSTFQGHLEDGGNREFDPDPYNSKFFDFPRISSGYFLEAENTWEIESLYISTGAWTHFVHPDDVYQIPDESNAKTSGHFSYRNKYGYNWYSKNGKKGMFDIFKGHITDYKKRHPFTRFLTATDASVITQNWRYAYYNHFNIDGMYNVESRNAKTRKGDNYWLLYIKKENTKSIEDHLNQEAATFKKVPFLEGNLFSIKTQDAEIALPDLYSNYLKSGLSNSAVIAEVKKEYHSFLENKDYLTPLNERLKRYVADGELKKATDLIELKMRLNPKIGTQAIWKEYATYMVWQKREKELWVNLDNFYLKNKSKNNADLSHIINEVADYIDISAHEKWLNRQLEWDTTNESVLLEYIEHFNTSDRQATVKKVLNTLINITDKPAYNKTYIDHLINYKDDDLIPTLEKIAPCDINYKDIANTVAWAFADNLRFDKALLWKDCTSGIDEATIEYWLLNSKSFDRVKKTNFPYYIALLLANDTQRALYELKKTKSCQQELAHLSKKIATAFGDYGNFKKAVQWSVCAKDIPIKSKLQWYYELNEIDNLKKTYKNYISKHPKDYDIKMLMATLMLYKSDVNEAAKIALSIPNHKIDKSFKKALNKEVLGMSVKEQIQMYKLYADLLDPEIGEVIAKIQRQEYGNSVGFNTYNISDAFKPITLENIVSYNFHNKKGDMHTISLTQSIMYALNVDIEDDNNIDHDLLGIQYMYTKKTNPKFQYTLRGRIEKDNLSGLFFQAGATYSQTKKKKFTAYELDLFPVKSGPGHSLDLYRTRLTVYKEIPFHKRFNQIIALETNYYTDGEYEAILLGRTEFALIKNKRFKLSPLVEGIYGRGSVDRRGGYPYWMDDNRLYGGGGVVLNVGTEKSKFSLNADFGIFAEQDEPSFERYTGNIFYRIKDFTKLTAGYEIYTIENFFSNVFLFGITHNFE